MSLQRVSSVLSGLKQWYNEINPATLTGAIDVIVVEQADGTFVSSPFHVRFGKLGVLKAKEKIVSSIFNYIKFIFSKKATKIDEIFTDDLTTCSKC